MPVPVKISAPGVVWPTTVGVLLNVTPPEFAGWWARGPGPRGDRDVELRAGSSGPAAGASGAGACRRPGRSGRCGSGRTRGCSSARPRWLRYALRERGQDGERVAAGAPTAAAGRSRDPRGGVTRVGLRALRPATCLARFDAIGSASRRDVRRPNDRAAVAVRSEPRRGHARAADSAPSGSAVVPIYSGPIGSGDGPTSDTRCRADGRSSIGCDPHGASASRRPWPAVRGLDPARRGDGAVTGVPVGDRAGVGDHLVVGRRARRGSRPGGRRRRRP